MEATQEQTQPLIETADAPMVEEEETWADIPEEIMGLSTDEIIARTRLIDNDVKVRILTLEIYNILNVIL
jgi:26S proteasome regulatory subunit T5